MLMHCLLLSDMPNNLQLATSNVAKNVSATTKPDDARKAIRGAVGGTPLPTGSLEAEQKAIGEFGRIFGRTPNSAEDWEVIHQGVYNTPNRPPANVPPVTTATGTPPNSGGAAIPTPEKIAPDSATQNRAQYPTEGEFTNILKNVMDVKLGRRPFIIGIPDEDLAKLTPATVRAQLAVKTNEILASGANVQAVMEAYQGMYKDTLDVADKYLKDYQDRTKQLKDFAFSEAVLSNGVLPPQLQGLLSPEEKGMWDQMSKYYVEQYKQKKIPEEIGHQINPNTGQTTYFFRDKFTGEITTQNFQGQPTKDNSPSITEQLNAAEKGYIIKDGTLVSTKPDPTKQIGGYDFTNYATDPNWGNAVNSIMSRLPNFTQKPNQSGDLDAYIKKISPKSQITGSDVVQVAQQYNIDPKLMVAIMQHESGFGTLGAAAKTFNPGNVGNVDSGATKNMGTWKSGIEALAQNISRRKSQTTTLGPEQELEAASLAKDVFGTVGARKQENVDKIKVLMQKGQSVNQIRDSLKYSGQSEKLSGTYRDAATSIAVNLDSQKSTQFFDAVDRLLERGNNNAVKELFKKQSLDSLPAEEAKTYRGKERLMVLVNSIEEDLSQFERLGGSTGIFSGNVEKIAGKIGGIKNKNLAYLANKINIAIQQYRQAVSGAAFSESESKEYRSIFPDVNKIKELNSAKIQSLRSATNTELDYIYSQRMGSDAYNQIFKESGDYSLILPNGNTASFPTKEQLDKFKSDHGI